MEPGATPLAEHHRLVGALAATLEAQGVPYFVVPGPTDRFTVGVRSSARSQLDRALAALAQAEDILLSPTSAADAPEFRPLGDGVDAGATQLQLWSPVAASDRRSLLGPDAHVTVQFWDVLADGSLQAPTPNRYAEKLTQAAAADLVRVTVGETSQPTVREMAEPHVDDIGFPVDLVYTWVDGADERWRARMLAARQRYQGPVDRASIDDSRFLNVDELRYSVRSAFAFAPWFRHLHLVTDGQVPDWLDRDHPRVSVVHHDEIWDDPGQLPVYNSHAIEARLHHIPGLADHYLYLNDDVFFGKLTQASTFFTPGGLCKFFPSTTRIGLGPPVLGEPPGSVAAKNDRRILHEVVGAIQTRRLRHTGHPQRRDVALELEERVPEVYRRTAGSKFRSPDDISPIALQSWYAYRTGRAVTASLRYRYVGLSRRAQLDRLDELRSARVTMLCLNQEEDKGEGDAVEAGAMTQALTDFLTHEYPFRSPLEADLPG